MADPNVARSVGTTRRHVPGKAIPTPTRRRLAAPGQRKKALGLKSAKTLTRGHTMPKPPGKKPDPGYRFGPGEHDFTNYQGNPGTVPPGVTHIKPPGRNIVPRPGPRPAPRPGGMPNPGNHLGAPAGVGAPPPAPMSNPGNHLGEPVFGTPTRRVVARKSK